MAKWVWLVRVIRFGGVCGSFPEHPVMCSDVGRPLFIETVGKTGYPSGKAATGRHGRVGLNRNGSPRKNLVALRDPVPLIVA